VLDWIIVTAVVGGAVAYLAWSFIPHKRKTPVACAACTTHSPSKQTAPVRTPGSP
jgi:hypothetical protein